MEAYRKANPKRRRRILPYLQAIHRRWYHATLIENTPFSPANLMESLCRYFGLEPDSYIMPELRTKAKVTGVDLIVKSYALENHPVVDDMRKLIEYCSPQVDLAEEGCFTDVQALELADTLSIVDPHYASYLLEVALWMKLLTKMPSLYVHRLQISKTYQDTIDLSNEALLRKIVDATISLAAFGLRTSIPMPEHIFSETFVRNLLTQPMETDDIFANVFELMGYDLNDLLEISNMPISDGHPFDLEDLGIDMELLSGTFVMGIVLDRFFFTPFGHFLRLIRPMYVIPFDFASEISDYTNVCDDPEEAFVAFFAPCSSYTLTDLGLEIIEVEPSSENYCDIADIIPFETMMDSVFSSPNAMAIFVEMARYLSPLAGSLPKNIYTFRIRLDEDPSAWIHLQISDTATLQELYEEIAHVFELEPSDDYSFFHDKTENRFAEYASPQKIKSSKSKKVSTKKTPDITLEELDFNHMGHMVLVSYSQGIPFGKVPLSIRFNLERLNEKPPELKYIYPRVSRTSAVMRYSLSQDE